jgi:hypothetical protein
VRISRLCGRLLLKIHGLRVTLSFGAGRRAVSRVAAAYVGLGPVGSGRVEMRCCDGHNGTATKKCAIFGYQTSPRRVHSEATSVATFTSSKPGVAQKYTTQPQVGGQRRLDSALNIYHSEHGDYGPPPITLKTVVGDSRFPQATSILRHQALQMLANSSQQLSPR